MGNENSKINQNPKIKQNQYPNSFIPDFLPNPILSESEPINILKYDLKLLTDKILEIPFPNEFLCISCLSLFSISILSIEFFFNSLKKINLSTFSISRFERGRLVCIGNIETLLLCTPNNFNGSYFIEKFLRWCGGPTPITRMICLYKINKEYSSILINNFEGLGFGIIETDFIEDIFLYTIIIIQSNYNDKDIFFDFINNGGCIICLGIINKPILINNYISKYGLSFLKIPLNNNFKKLNHINNYNIQILSSFNQHLIDFQNNFNDIIEDLDFFKLFSLILLNEIKNSSIEHNFTELFYTCLDYLEKNNSFQQNLYFINENQQILAEILHLIYCHSKPDSELLHNLSEKFLGISLNIDFDELEFIITLNGNQWEDTGIWIQPSNLIILQCEKYIPEGEFLIGCHNYIPFEKKGPWKRFPFITSKFKMFDKFKEFSSPFGGILIYIPSNNEIINNKKSFKLNISEGAYYPFYKIEKNDQFELKKDNKFPWGQINTKYFHFYLPKKSFPNINLLNFCNNIDQLLIDLNNLLGLSINNPFKIVFDIEFPNNLIINYPIYLNIDFISLIFNFFIKKIFYLFLNIIFNILNNFKNFNDFYLSLTIYITFYFFNQKFSNLNLNELLPFNIPNNYEKISNYFLKKDFLSTFIEINLDNL